MVYRILIYLFLSASTGFCRIGDSRIESLERYGPEHKNAYAWAKIPTASFALFESGDIRINEAIVEMETVAVSYTTRIGILTASQVKNILAAEGTDWMPYSPEEPMNTNMKNSGCILMKSKEGLVAKLIPFVFASVEVFREETFNRLYGKPLGKKSNL